MNYEYLIFNILILSCPFVVTFFLPHIKIPSFRESYKAIALPALIFIIWDQLVTGFFWNFNHQYIINIYIGHIPIEEFLFFFTTSYTCLFVWLVLKDITASKKINRYASFFIFLVSSICTFLALLNKLWYTSLVMIGMSITVYIDDILKTEIYRTKRSYIFMTIILSLTAIFNLYLTWRPVVIYNRFVKTNIMVGTIPVEDFIYGLVFIISVIILYEYERKAGRAHQKA